MYCELQKKKIKRSSSCFPTSVRPAASIVFPNMALCVKSLSIPALNRVLGIRLWLRVQLTQNNRLRPTVTGACLRKSSKSISDASKSKSERYVSMTSLEAQWGGVVTPKVVIACSLLRLLVQ